MSSFPVPPPNVQPPSLPLISQNPAAAALALGLAPPPTTTQSTRRFPLIPNIRVPFRPSLGGLALDTEWAKMDMVIPLLKPSSRADKALDDGDVAQEDDTAIGTNTRRERETRRRALRPELDCQLFKIKHEVRIALHCSYEDPQASSSAMADSPPRKKQTLYATLPVRFADILPRDLPVPPSPPPSATSTLAPSIFSSSFPSLVTSSPPTPLSSLLFFDLPYGDSIVPAYTELFYENGERRDDDFDSEWLPVYEPRRMDGKDTPCGCHEDDESPA